MSGFRKSETGPQRGPIYYQVANRLREKILSGEMKAGSQLPPEEVLRNEYEVSRVTIRAALKKLNTEGLILRVNGKGTFVATFEKRRQLILVVERPPKEIPHLHELVMGAICAGQDLGYQVLVMPYERFREQIDQTSLAAGIHAGALLLRCRNVRPEDIHYAESKGVVCLLEGMERLQNCNWLAVDNADAMNKIIDHLFRQGCRRYAIVTTEPSNSWSSFRERTEGAVRRLSELKVPASQVVLLTLSGFDLSSQSPHELAALLSQGGSHPDAVVCINDLLAAQVVRYLTSHYLRVPEDIKVTGFDDAPIARFISPNLTTVRQDYFESGSHAVRQLHRLQTDFCNKRIQDCRKLELVIRGSTQ